MSHVRRFALALVAVLLTAGSAHADRRYFVHSYTPYVAPAGNLEFEWSAFADNGQGDTAATAWENKLELEYAISDRLTGAAYLNFVQEAGQDQPTVFDGPSLEFIYRLAEPGRLPVDPAAYLEVRANGSEVEFEPKLLLARRIYRLVTGLNVIGEIEPHTAGPENGTTEKKLRVTAGASREIGHTLAVGVEAVYARQFLDQGDDPHAVFLGPTVNLQAAKAQITLGWQPQLSGGPAGRTLDVADFPRSTVRLIVGVEL